MKPSKNDTLTIVAHDAGAANHLFAWLKTDIVLFKTLKLCLSGPAKTLYESQYPSFINHTLEDALSNADYLLSGTSWPSTFEYDARLLAQQKGIFTIAMVDHWTNYQQRFNKNKQICLPDSIWVIDHYAESLAKSTFPTVPVHIQANHFIQQQVDAIAALEKNKISDPNQHNILFVMEPIAVRWKNQKELSEIQALDYFLLKKGLLGLKSQKTDTVEKIIIKPHPMDQPGKYQSWLDTTNTKTDIRVDESSNLAQLIAWSDMVVGCQTYAMVVALAAGKKVISALPDYAPPCVLPHKEIIHLRTL